MADIYDTQFECSEPFGIDNRELDGLTPQFIFTLGVEWQIFATGVGPT